MLRQSPVHLNVRDLGRDLCVQVDAAGAQPGNRSCLNFEAAEDPNWLCVI